MHYNSEVGSDHVFGTTRAVNELNCLRLEFHQNEDLQPAVGLVDCDKYAGTFSNSDITYNLTLQNVDPASSCSNRTIHIEGLHIWANADKSVIVFWSCQNDRKMKSQKQVVVVFLDRDLLESTATLEYPKILQMTQEFTSRMIAFSVIRLDNFLVNDKIQNFNNQSCNFICSSTCELEPQRQAFEGSIIFFVVIGFLVVIVFVIFI